MDGSILKSVRLACDVGEDDNSFDGQLIPLTNTFLFRVAQIGLGEPGFTITGEDENWGDFIWFTYDDYAAVRSYIGIRVKLIFDPPDNSALLSALKEEAKELEWCLYDEADIVNSAE